MKQLGSKVCLFLFVAQASFKFVFLLPPPSGYTHHYQRLSIFFTESTLATYIFLDGAKYLDYEDS